MKTTVLIILVVIFQTRASFYDDITGAMGSVEKAFGKLLNDVVTDVKNTVHCTILAMEQVLAISGALNESTSNIECYDSSENSYNPPVATEKDYHGIYSENDINEQLSSSISKMNETLTKIFDNDGHERLKEIKKVLKNETDRLTEVSRLLRQELEKISNRFKNKYENNNSNTSSLESLWNNMKILHELEVNDKNSSEVNEIGQVLNEAMNVLNVNTTTNITSDADKIKVIIQELEHESNNNNITRNKIESELSEWNYLKPTFRNYSGYVMSPPNLKILRDKDKLDAEIHNYSSNISTSTVPETKLSVEKSQIKDNATNNQQTFSASLGPTDNNSTDPVATHSTDQDTTDTDSTDLGLSGTVSTDSGPTNTFLTDSGTADVDSTDSYKADTELIDSGLIDIESIGSRITSTDSDTEDTDSANLDPSDIDSTDSDPTDTDLDIEDTDTTNSGLADTDDTDSTETDLDKEDTNSTNSGSTDTDYDADDTDSTDTDLDKEDTSSINSGSTDTDYDAEDTDSTDTDPTDTYLKNFGVIDRERDISSTDTDLDMQGTDSTDLGSVDADSTDSDPIYNESVDSSSTDTDYDTEDTDYIDPGSADADMTDVSSEDNESEDLSSTGTDLDTEDTDYINSDSADADLADSGALDTELTDSGSPNTDSTDSNTTDTDLKDSSLLDKKSTYSGLFDTNSTSSNQVDLTNFDVVDSLVGAISKEEHKKAVDQAKEIIDNNSNMEVTLNKLFSDSRSNHELLDFDNLR